MKYLKLHICELLSTGDSEAVLRWAEDARNPLRILIPLIFDGDTLICFRAVQIMGVVASKLAEKDIDIVRRLIRRFLWMMNDESGNVAWKAPEAIGEILHNVPQLILEYGHLISSFLEMEPFREGARIAVSRIGARDDSCFDELTVRTLIESLDDEDARIRASSLMALKALGVNIPDSSIERLLSDRAGIEYYDFERDEMIKTTVGDLAKLL